LFEKVFVIFVVWRREEESPGGAEDWGLAINDVYRFGVLESLLELRTAKSYPFNAIRCHQIGRLSSLSFLERLPHYSFFPACSDPQVVSRKKSFSDPGSTGNDPLGYDAIAIKTFAELFVNWAHE
jgi:hypothetical protein